MFLFFVAEAAFAWTFESVAAIIAALVVGTGIFTFFVSLVMRGIWAKMGEPIVKNMFLAWYRDPDQVMKREVEVKSVIDNQIQRVDGIIRKEISTQVDNLQEEFSRSFNEFKVEFREDHTSLKNLITAQNELAETYRTNVLTRLSKIDGVMHIITKGSSSSPSDMPYGPLNRSNDPRFKSGK